MKKFFEIIHLWFRKITLINIIYFIITLPLLLGIYLCANAAFGVKAGEAVADFLPGLGFYMSIFSSWNRWLLWTSFAVSALLYGILKCFYYVLITSFYNNKYRFITDVINETINKRKKSLIIGLLDVLICGQLIINLSGLNQWFKIANIIIKLGSAIVLIFWIQVRRYIFLMLSSTELKLGQIIKNSVILSVTGLGNNGKSLAISIIIWSITYLTIPIITVILLPIFSYSANNLAITCCLYPEINKYIIKKE